MSKVKLDFESIFEGESVKPAMKKKISTLLNDVVNRKVKSRLNEEKDKDEDDDEDEELKKKKKKSEDEDGEEVKEEKEPDEDDADEPEPDEDSDDEEPKKKKKKKSEEDESEDELKEPPPPPPPPAPPKPPTLHEDEDEEAEPEDDEEGKLGKGGKKKKAPADDVEECDDEDKDKKEVDEADTPEDERDPDKKDNPDHVEDEEKEPLEENSVTELIDTFNRILRSTRFRRVGQADTADFGSIAEIKNSFRALFIKTANNEMAKPAINFLKHILEIIADNSYLSNLLVKKISKVQPAGDEKPGDEEEEAKDEMVDEQLLQHVDRYLSYIAEQWAENNKVALENGIKVQLAESFLQKFNDIYRQFNIKNVPSRDLVVEVTQKVTDAEERLNEQMKINSKLVETANKEKRTKLIDEAAKPLPATQAEKFRKLAESVSFENDSSFIEKLNNIKETAFNSKKEVKKGEKLEESVNNVPDNPQMARYVEAINKNLKF